MELGDAVPSERIVEEVESRDHLQVPQPQHRKLPISFLAHQKVAINPLIMKSRQLALALEALHPGNVHT